MNDKIKQLWCDIQCYGEVLSQVDKSDYNNFYTDRTHKYQNKIYESVMLNGEVIVLFKRYDYEIYSYTNGEKLLDRTYWLPVGLEIVDTLGGESC